MAASQTPTEQPAVIALTADQFKELLAAAAGNKPDREQQIEFIRMQAEANAEANRKLLKPENATHPGKSVYSHPEGEQAKPKAAFTFPKVTWGGFPVPHESSTVAEVEGLNALTAGRYFVGKADGTKIEINVVDEFDAQGVAVSRAVNFNAKVHKDGLMPLVQMCRDMIAQAKAKAVPAKVA
jgi:hypothetical protein